MKKKLLSLILVVAVSITAVGCAKKTPEAVVTPEPSSTTEKMYTIGISQFAEHGSLDNCREGFVQGLAQEGFVEGENLTILFENALADTGTAGQIADNFMTKGVDMICGIATISAASAYNAAMNTDVPVVFTAITDPVLAGFAKEDGTPAGNITGTSDKLPVEEQLKMIRTILPEAKTIGIMYTTSETNSVAAIEEYKTLAGDFGFTIETVGISSTADVPLAADSLVSKVDCITNLTDNTVVQSLATVLEKAGKAKIPVFGSEVEQVKNGCLAAVGLEFVDLGVQTGVMAAKILKGEAEASTMNFQTVTESDLYLNSGVAKSLGITIDSEYAAKAVNIFFDETEQ